MRKWIVVILTAICGVANAQVIPPGGGGSGGGGYPSLTLPSGDTTCTSDTAAIQTIANSQGAVQLGKGTYYIDLLNIPGPTFFLAGVGADTIINKCGATGYFATINTDWSGTGNILTGVVMRDFMLNQKSGVTPTAGGGFKLFNSTSGHYVTGPRI